MVCERNLAQGSSNTPPDTQQASAAAQGVGSVAEVVAAVVKHMSTTDLARAQAISKTWRYEITRSPTCQEKLFLLPVPRIEALVWYLHNPQTHLVSRHEYHTEDDVPDDAEHSRIVTAVHPFLQHKQSPGDGWSGIAPVDVDIPTLVSLPDGGPLQQMYVSQPPAKQMTIEWEFVLEKGPFLHQPFSAYKHTQIAAPAGVRIRHLVDAFRNGVNFADPDYWSWLRDQYSPLDLAVDDYLATSGFPTLVGARLGIPGCVDERVELVRRARGCAECGTPCRAWISHFDGVSVPISIAVGFVGRPLWWQKYA
jgi:hypothetical protein